MAAEQQLPVLSEEDQQRLIQKAEGLTGKQGLQLTGYNPDSAGISIVYVIDSEGEQVGYFRDIGPGENFIPDP